MNTVTVHASRCYDVKVGSGILSSIAETVQHLSNAKKICIVSDSNVFPIYGNIITRYLREAKFDTCNFVFQAGENSKNSSVYLGLLNILAQNELTRSDCLIALGGGVVGDLAGFAAATYLRGIRYIQIPTTLLAMVDSSVGGKTAINLPSGKNLIGAFWQPDAVICDTDTLNTLPESVFRDGCAEVIKYGVLFDPALFSQLEKFGLSFDRQKVITRCVELKRDVVMQDERESSARKLLNLGHTIGHAIEKSSNYTISHGQAVAIGMAMIFRGIHHPQTGRITALLQQFGLPTATHFSVEELYNAALSDKKRQADTVDLIIPDTIGRCVIANIPIESLKNLIKEGM